LTLVIPSEILVAMQMAPIIQLVEEGHLLQVQAMLQQGDLVIGAMLMAFAKA